MKTDGIIKHDCLSDPDAGFPSGLPDVDADGLTGDGKQGPFDHACKTCGINYQWAEYYGFVCWQPVEEWPIAEAIMALAAPSRSEERLYT